MGFFWWGTSSAVSSRPLRYGPDRKRLVDFAALLRSRARKQAVLAVVLEWPGGTVRPGREANRYEVLGVGRRQAACSRRPTSIFLLPSPRPVSDAPPTGTLPTCACPPSDHQ